MWLMMHPTLAPFLLEPEHLTNQPSQSHSIKLLRIGNNSHTLAQFSYDLILVMPLRVIFVPQ